MTKILLAMLLVAMVAMAGCRPLPAHEHEREWAFQIITIDEDRGKCYRTKIKFYGLGLSGFTDIAEVPCPPELSK